MNSDTPKHQPTAQGPTADQLAAARLAKWHQNAAPLLTIEELRAWINANGLVLYSSRAQQLPSPAPSLVEAALGSANAEPSLEDTSAARNLLARLIAEGAAVPLNLLGVTGATGTDTPDFLVSAAVFSYIFTLRGNKAWKQPPVTSGAVKVSPLALATYEILAQKVTLSAYDLTTQLGKEVTEAAVLRALTELWSQLRVIPVPQQDGSATLWELSTVRFTKQIKAGANAGQPSALSALISLYLGQAIAATEDEIETFLSPLAPRSRVRDVVHALLGARQLETFVVDGKTLLHVAGDLPAFASETSAGEASLETSLQGLAASSDDGSRIRKFTPKPGSKIGTGLRSKPSFGSRPPFGSKPSFGARSGKPAYGKPSADHERRPFQRDGDRPNARPTFNKPWDEDRAVRASRPESGAEQGNEAPRTFTPRPARPFGDRPSAGGSRPGGFAGKPRFDSRSEGSPRKTFSKPGTFGRKREGFEGKPSFGGASDRGDARRPRRESGENARPSFDRGDRGDRPASGGFQRPGSYSPRPPFGARPGFGSKPDFNGQRPDRGSARPSFDRNHFDRKPGSGAKPPLAGDRMEQAGPGGEAPRKTFRRFDAPRSPKPFGSKPNSKFASKPFHTDRSDRGAGSDRPSRPFTSRVGSDRPSFGARPGGAKPFSAGPGGKSFGAKKPSAFAGKGGPFAKFADGKKPFRKPGPSKPAGGGFTPTRRKRPEDEV